MIDYNAYTVVYKAPPMAHGCFDGTAAQKAYLQNIWLTTKHNPWHAFASMPQLGCSSVTESSFTVTLNCAFRVKQFGGRVFSESVPRLWNARPQILMRVRACVRVFIGNDKKDVVVVCLFIN